MTSLSDDLAATIADLIAAGWHTWPEGNKVFMTSPGKTLNDVRRYVCLGIYAQKIYFKEG